MTETPEFVRENLWTIHAAARDSYEDRGRVFPADTDANGERCVACGRKIGKSVLTVEVHVDGYVILPGDPASGTIDSQGEWNLGSECSKRVLTRDEIATIRAAHAAAR